MPEAEAKQSPAFSCPFSTGAHAEKGHIYYQPRYAERISPSKAAHSKDLSAFMVFVFAS